MSCLSFGDQGPGRIHNNPYHLPQVDQTCGLNLDCLWNNVINIGDVGMVLFCFWNECYPSSV